ncbi:proline-rich transmembrane protein 1 [Mastacembelus armatus]|uniref:proline-rich transmembrane protein 1 n=1 Tax=Mastacembelus armatus TaxID=205130 RepID=UPI000E453B48|nr:proline-rich transmembrane protein 1-like [Mastacembelus armatus]
MDPKVSAVDPSRSTNVPPPQWTDEKSSMNQAAPPPYHDMSYQGYPQPGPGYPPQPQYAGAGYGQQPYPSGQQYPGQQYPGQPTTVTIQPTVYVTRAPLAEPVNDYLGYSIFTMLCCCLPLGIAALIYSISAREANLSGDRATAERSSKLARTLNHVALGLGIGLTVVVIIFSVVTSISVH